MTNQMNSVNVQLILTTKEFDLSSHQVLSFNQLNDYPDTPNHKQFDIHRIASIMFTSGTTGPQKAVPQTFKNHYASALGCKESLDLINKRHGYRFFQFIIFQDLA